MRALERPWKTYALLVVYLCLLHKVAVFGRVPSLSAIDGGFSFFCELFHIFIAQNSVHNEMVPCSRCRSVPFLKTPNCLSQATGGEELCRALQLCKTLLQSNQSYLDPPQLARKKEETNFRLLDKQIA
mmetsp:Transcript_996/g.2507  ORF Transcript_996/g.2507 Transcript_996/m.2507 type:complete len:128 (-) Transcript_996:924-1307(-)